MDAGSTRERGRRVACRLGVLGTLALGAVGLAGSVSTADASAAQRPYVALGDSISAGWGASSPAKGFVERLYADYQSSLGANPLFNLAVPGATSTTLMSGGQLASGLADVNAPTDTAALTIAIGINDGWLGPCNGHWSQPVVCPFRANYSQILRQLRIALAADPGAESFKTMTYYNPANGLGSAQELWGDKLLFGDNLKVDCTDTGSDAGLTDVIDQEAGRLNIPVANIYPAFKQGGQAFISSDNIHPSDAGYAAIAQSFRDATVPCRPETRFVWGPVSGSTRDRTPRFGFRSSDAGSRFECSLDGAAFTACATPHTTPTLSFARHSFRVRAINQAGNTDRTPAVAAFAVVH